MSERTWIYDAVVTSEHDGDTISLTAALTRTALLGSQEPTPLGFGVWVEQLPWMQTAKQTKPPTYITYHLHGRFLGLNAPEIATPEGKAALAYLTSILPVGTKVKINSSKPVTQIGADKYGNRWDVVVMLNGVSINDLMIQSGHAAAWNGQGEKPLPAD